MIKYTETKDTYFKSQEQFEQHIAAMQASENMPKDVATALKLNGYAIEKHAHKDVPSYSTHTATMMPQLSIGVQKSESPS